LAFVPDYADPRPSNDFTDIARHELQMEARTTCACPVRQRQIY
jgi:hypothetical protein